MSQWSSETLLSKLELPVQRSPTLSNAVIYNAHTGGLEPYLWQFVNERQKQVPFPQHQPS